MRRYATRVGLCVLLGWPPCQGSSTLMGGALHLPCSCLGWVRVHRHAWRDGRLHERSECLPDLRSTPGSPIGCTPPVIVRPFSTPRHFPECGLSPCPCPLRQAGSPSLRTFLRSYQTGLRRRVVAASGLRAVFSERGLVPDKRGFQNRVSTRYRNA